MKISIEYLSDFTDCEQCGGGSAEGFICRVDGEERIRRQPRASCFGGDSWSWDEMWQIIIKELYGDDLDIEQ